ncbi:MAG: Exodeoxyribonuclease [Gammaproteobacteria bacterium]|jgi:exodeoxyribonuclease-3|nr:Exodeoxyribonuclease [Gammaproteobacteria bacterium]
MFKVASWNVNSLKIRLSHVLQWLTEHEPSVLALQEIKLIDANFPVEPFEQLGYHAIFSGQKTYNGVAILAKQPLADIDAELPGWVDPQRRVLAATCGGIRIINLYIPNGESLTSEKYQYKLLWLKALQNYLQQQLQRYSRIIILGDFNIAPAEQDVHDPMAWQNRVLFSQPEREVFQQLLNLGFKDTFRLFEQPEESFSWWDYRAAAFRRNLGLRIDHILASGELAKYCQAAGIDKQPRKWERPSDHTPVWTDFLLD